MAQKEVDKRMEARRARVEAARSAAEPEDEATPVTDEPLTDYWKLPKTGARTTLLNSAWTWTLITYVSILAIAAFSVAQNELGFLDSQSNTARIAIAVGLIYPAWRIGSIISRFMKKRGIGAEFSMTAPSAKPKGQAKPGSVEARMAERRTRLEKARKDGKI